MNEATLGTKANAEPHVVDKHSSGPPLNRHVQQVSGAGELG